MSATLDELMGMGAKASSSSSSSADTNITPDGGKGRPSSGHQYLDSLFLGLTRLTKIANGIPSKSADFDYLASFPEFQASVDSSGDGILELIKHLVGQLVAGELVLPVDLTHLSDLTDESNFEKLSDTLEQVLEAADVDLDSAQGIDRSTKQAFVARSAGDALNAGKSKVSDMLSLSSSAVAKPQLVHGWAIDNSRESRFRPLILSMGRSKPNAVAPLDRSGSPRSPTRERLPSSIRNSIESHARDTLGIDTVRMECEAADYAHPYEAEIRGLVRSSSQLEAPAEAKRYESLETTQCTWVDTPETLDTMRRILEDDDVTEIAVDLEHHHYRSFQGFLCLMQISTRSEDFLVDTIVLRNELHVLQHVFTNPRVVKVLHGADRDIIWLQRDLGLYVVNMFDTGQCARVLDYPSKSLAYLLKTKCGVTAQKQYQLADWRIRPLPDVLRKYAREDTHYLLYIYDLLRIELGKKSNPSVESGTMNSSFFDIKDVFARSDRLCLTTYRKEIFTDLRYLDVIRNLRLELSPPQKRVFAALYDWRDRVAREEDESTGYVLSNRMLAKLSSVMPDSSKSLAQCLNPIPELVRRYTMDVLRTISQAASSEQESTARSSLVEENSQGLNGLTPFSPIESVNAMALMDIDMEEAGHDKTAIPSQTAKSGAAMTVEEIYEFAGWIPDSWLDPSVANTEDKIREGRASDLRNATLSSANRDFSSTSPLSESTPLEPTGGTFVPSMPANFSGREKVNEIRASMDANSVSFLNLNGSTFGENANLEKGEQNGLSSVASAVDNGVVTNNEQQVDDAEMIPRSMSEIYKISVRNRNATKSRSPKVGLDRNSNDLRDAASDSDGPSARKRPAVTGFSSLPAPHNESEFEFCARIGWIDSGDAQKYQKIKTSTSGGKSASQKGGRGIGDDAGSSSPIKRAKNKSKKQRTRRTAKSKHNSSGFQGYNYGMSSSDSQAAAQHGGNVKMMYKDLSGRNTVRHHQGSNSNSRSNRQSRNLHGGRNSQEKSDAGRTRRKARGGRQQRK